MSIASVMSVSARTINLDDVHALGVRPTPRARPRASLPIRHAGGRRFGDACGARHCHCHCHRHGAGARVSIPF